MEQESLFTSSKWDILKCLKSGSKSPIDLAKETNTSVANISQQLRLLELAGFVKSERISNRDKGMPRVLYSLADNYSYIVVGAKGFVDKKFLELSDHQLATLKIWFLDDEKLTYYLEKFYWTFEHLIEKTVYLGFDLDDSKNVHVYVISENSEWKKSKELTISGQYGQKTFTIHQIKEGEKAVEDQKRWVLLDRR